MTVHAGAAPASSAPDWRRAWSELDPVPAAAASIGQVHRGRWGRPRGRGQGAVPRRRRGPALRPAPARAGWPGRSGPLVAGHGRQAAGRRAAGADRGGARLRPRGRGPARRSPRSSRGDPDIVVPDVVRRQRRRCWSPSGWTSPASLARVIRDGTQAERDHYGGLLRPVPLRRPGPRRAAARRPASRQLPAAPATTAPRAAWACSTTAPWPGCPTAGCRGRWAR